MTGAADTWTGEEWPDDEETKRRLRGDEAERLRPTDSEENLFVLMDPGDTPLPRRRPDRPSQGVGQAAPPGLARLGEPEERAPWGGAASSPDTTERWEREHPPETTERWEREHPPETTERWADEAPARQQLEGGAVPRQAAEPRRDEPPRGAPPPRQEPAPPPPRSAPRAEPRGSSSPRRPSESDRASETMPRSSSGRRKRGRRLGLGTKLALFGGLSFGLAFAAARLLPPKHPTVPSQAKRTPGAPDASKTGGSPAAGQTAGPAPATSGAHEASGSPEAPELPLVPAASPEDPELKAPLRRIIGRKGTVVLTNGEEIDGRFIGFERDKILLGLSPSGRTGIPFTRIADLRLQDGTSVWRQSFTERAQALKRQEAKRRATLSADEKP